MWGLTILIAISIHCTVSSELNITKVEGPAINLPDSIFWNDKDQSMYYADYLTVGNQSSIFRYDYNKNKVYEAYIAGKQEIVYLLPVEGCRNNSEKWRYKDKLYMAAAQNNNFLISWNGYEPVAEVIRTVFNVEENYPSSKMDLSKQNTQGKFFGGTTTDQYCAGPSNSSLYTYSIAKGLQKISSGYQCTAGMTHFGDTIYHTDVCHQTVTEIKEDRFGNYASRVLFDFKTQDNTTRPSGLEVDSNGYLYVVGYTNGKVWRIDPSTSTGEVIATFPFYLTGVAFGGPNRDILFVMTSSALIQAWPLKVLKYKKAPPLYMITGLGARGVVFEKLQC